MITRRFLLASLAALGLALSVEAAPKKLLMIASGPDGHPPMTHEYEAGLKLLAKLLKDVDGLDVTVVRADGKWAEGPDLIGRADGVVLFATEGAKWIQADPERFAAFKKLAARKGGLTVLHWGMGTKKAEPIAGFRDIFGGCHGGPDRRYKVVEVKAQVANREHPITRGIADFNVKDEFYYKLKMAGLKTKPEPLLRVPIEGELHAVAWSWQRPNGGRSFGFSGLHFHKNWGLQEYRRLVTQGVLWTMGIPIRAKGLDVPVTDQDLKIEGRARQSK